MDNEVKQRNRRRKRAQRMHAQRESKATIKDGDSAEDESPVRQKPQRPPNRRKKPKEPLVEEDIVDGFAILGFRTYEDLESVIKLASKAGIRRLTGPTLEEKLKEDVAHRNSKLTLSTHHISIVHPAHHSLTHDPGTSDDSGRASERLTGSSVAPRDPDSSRDRLSDASSRCSSGKGYICDSEGEDDKRPAHAREPSHTGSDAGSVLFASTPTARKLDYPGALAPGNGGESASPVPAPTPPSLAPPAPSPAPAALPPPQPYPAPSPAATGVAATPAAAAASMVSMAAVATVASSCVASMASVVSSGNYHQQPQLAAQLAAQLPPPVPAAVPASAAATTAVSVAPPITAVPAPPPPASVPVTMPQPAAAPAPAAHLPPALDSQAAHMDASRTDSPAVATSANAAVAPAGGGQQYHHPAFPSLYAPYAVHSPYTAPSPAGPGAPPQPAAAPPAPPAPLAVPQPVPVPASTAASAAAVVTSASAPPAITTIASQHREMVTGSRTHSPRGHSPTRERDSYSSNVSSLSRGSVTPFSGAPPTSAAASAAATVVSSSALAPYPKGPTWGTPHHHHHQAPPPQPPPQLSPANGVPRPAAPSLAPGMHPFPAPMFAPPPLPPVSAAASPLGMAAAGNQVPPNPNPFSAESLFQSNQADMLRRELDSRFLASQDRSLNVGPPPYLRTEMHQHQHHHTHVHQHTTPLGLGPPPGAAGSALFPAPLFKDMPKMGAVDSPFYRQNIGLAGYPGYSPAGLLHPGLGGPTPFVPPNHLPTFQPKQPIADSAKPKLVKTGKWNAMHVRVAWEIYHHQQKQQSEAKAGVTAKADLLRPPSHMFPGSLIHTTRPHELSFPPSLAGHRPPPSFDPQPHPGSLFSNPASHLVNGSAGSGISPFSRYSTAFTAPGSPFSLSPFPSARDLPPLGPLHDPWGRLQRAVPGFPPAPVPQAPWGLKPDPAVLERREQEERERERERERCRREREERERREREEKQRKQMEQQQQERERERREKERREMERREMERERERERERMMHQQRIAESNKQAAALAAAARDRSPLRNGSSGDHGEIRVKEEPRAPKEEDVVMLGRTAGGYHPYLNRHPTSIPPHAPHSMLDRSRGGMLPSSLGGPPLPPHFPPSPASHWAGPDPFRDPYRFDPLRYNPLVEAAMRAEEERAKLFSAYAGHPAAAAAAAHLRAKEAVGPGGPGGPGPPPGGMLHMRAGPGPGPPPPHKMCATPPTAEMHKKDDSSQSR